MARVKLGLFHWERNLSTEGKLSFLRYPQQVSLSLNKCFIVSYGWQNGKRPLSNRTLRYRRPSFCPWLEGNTWSGPRKSVPIRNINDTKDFPLNELPAYGTKGHQFACVISLLTLFRWSTCRSLSEPEKMWSRNRFLISLMISVSKIIMHSILICEPSVRITCSVLVIGATEKNSRIKVKEGRKTLTAARSCFCTPFRRQSTFPPIEIRELANN